MTFRVTRTSDAYCDEKAPCKNARFVKRIKEREWSISPTNIWEIEVDSLEDLMKLIEETGKGLIIFGADKHGGPTIEIYDDYRE